MLALLLLLALLAPTPTAGQWSPTRAPTWHPTPAPTAAPLTDRCRLSGYQQFVAGNNASESCLACRRDFECAWCIPDNAAAAPFCIDNRVSACPGRMGSYSTDICTKPLSAGTAAAFFAAFILLPLLCCAGCCFMAFRRRARRPGAAAVLVTGGGAMGGQQRPPTPVGVMMPQYPVGPVTTGGYGYPGGQPSYPQGAAPPPYNGPAQPQQQQPTYYYSAPGVGQASYATTAYGGGGDGRVSPAVPLPPPSSPPPPPSYSTTDYGYGGQSGKGAYM